MRVARTVVRVSLVLFMAGVAGALLWARRDNVQISGIPRRAQSPVPPRVLRAVIAVEAPTFPAPSLTERLAAPHVEGRTISRLARQLIVSLVVDLRFDPHEIATAYCNSVYFGRVSGSSLLFGSSAAPAAYFGKPPVAQLAALVASIRSQAVYSPAVQTERAAARRRTVLRRFVAAGVVTPSEMVEAEKELSARGIS